MLNELTQNESQISIGNLTVYKSYSTVIAFRLNGELTITQNNWGNTTGKHLSNICSDKSIRIPYEEFKAKCEALKIS